MEVLVRVVETGSFSGAAKQLRVGQPAVSKTIAQLEGRLGVSLLLRSSRGLTPTEAGQNFYERAKRSIEEADEAELAAREAGNGLAGRLRFSAGVTCGRLHIMPRLPLFLAAHPELVVEAILDDRNVDLIEEGIDADFAWHARRLHDGGPQDRTIASAGARHTLLFREGGGAVDTG
jgi:DNA-binding transcriptional LysR family regulator